MHAFKKEIQAKIGIVGSATLLGLSAFLFYWQLREKVKVQQTENFRLEKQIQDLDLHLKEKIFLEKKEQQLKMKIAFLQKQRQRQQYSEKIFESLALLKKERFYLTYFSHNAAQFMLEGKVQQTEEFSQFMQQLNEISWLQDPQVKLLQRTEEEKLTAVKEDMTFHIVATESPL